MLLGAIVGALLVRVSLVLPLIIMAALVALTAVAYVGQHASQQRHSRGLREAS